MPKKQRFFVIKSKEYGSPMFYFTSLDGAMKIFEYLIAGNAVNVEQESISLSKTKKSKESWRDTEELHYISKKEPDYHLSSIFLNIYTKKEIAKIEKERKKKRREK